MPEYTKRDIAQRESRIETVPLSKAHTHAIQTLSRISMSSILICESNHPSIYSRYSLCRAGQIHNRRVNIHVDVGLWLQISSAVALGVTLLIRLLAVKHFGGAVVDLNAGVKGESNTSNLAFTSEANTVGHILQGGLVVFLFPLHQNAIFGSFSALGLLV